MAVGHDAMGGCCRPSWRSGATSTASPYLPAGRAPQLDRVVSQGAPKAKSAKQIVRRPETGGLDHRLGVRTPEGVHHPLSAHGDHTVAGSTSCWTSSPGSWRDLPRRCGGQGGRRRTQAARETPGIEVANCAASRAKNWSGRSGVRTRSLVRSETRVTADLLTRGPNLRVIARAGTGVDNIDVHAATRRGIAVMNAPGANTVSARRACHGSAARPGPPHSVGGGGDAPRRMGSQAIRGDRAPRARPSGSSGWAASAAMSRSSPARSGCTWWGTILTCRRSAPPSCS